MARFIPEDVVEEVRSRSNIIDIIGSYIKLDRAGGNNWKAVCPFHDEKTPSFHVRGDHQLYHCFGCGRGGDVYRFVMEKENVQFPEAVHILANRCGVIIPETTSDGDRERGKEIANKRERLYLLNEEFAKFFENNLARNSDWPAAKYLAGRHIDSETIAHFRIGATPDSWDACLKHGLSLGFSKEEMHQGGIIRQHKDTDHYYDHLKGRLTFAIWNEQGRVVGFSARSLEAKPRAAKYVNTPETPVFKKGSILYALPFARQAMNSAKEAIICEGQLDTIAFHRAGYENAVAPQGTGFTTDQARILRRYVDTVNIAFDSDNAGQKAVRSAIEILLPLEFEIKVTRLPDGTDPDDIFSKSGAAGVKNVVENATAWLNYLIETFPTRYDMNSPEGQTRAVGEIVELILKIDNPISRELYVKECAALLKLSENSIISEINRQQKMTRRAIAGGGQTNYKKDLSPIKKTETKRTEHEAAELVLLEISINHEDIARSLADQLDPDKLNRSFAGRALNEVLGLTMNGEHELCRKSVATMLTTEQNEKVSKILATENSSISGDNIKKAIKDCLTVLKHSTTKRTYDEIIDQLKSTQDPVQKIALLEELQKL